MLDTAPRPDPSAAPLHPAGPPRLRLLPAPPSEPPYDDEAPTRPQLRLVPPLPVRPAKAPTPPARREGRVPPHPLVEPPLQRTPTAQLPDARRVAVALVQRLLEVRGGARPVQQLQRDTTPSLYADLERVLARASRQPSGAPRPSGRDLHRVHVQERPDGVAEVCATVRRGDRYTALALRLDGVHGRWLCSQLTGL